MLRTHDRDTAKGEGYSHPSRLCRSIRRASVGPAGAGPEEFVSLQSLLVQSSKLFGASSMQISFLVTSLSGKFVQFSWARGTSDSVLFVQFSSFSSFHELFRPWLGLTWLARFVSGSVQSIEYPIVWEEQRSSSRSPPAEIPARRPGVCRLGGEMVRFAGCA